MSQRSGSSSSGVSRIQDSTDINFPAFSDIEAVYYSTSTGKFEPGLFQPGSRHPLSHGLKAWAGEPSVFTESGAPSNGEVQYSRIDIPYDMSVSTIHFVVQVAATAPTAGSCWVGLYNQNLSAKLLAADIAIEGVVNSIVSKGKALPLGQTVNLTGGSGNWIYAAIVMTATTNAQLFRHGTNDALVNYGLTNSTPRCGRGGGGATTLPNAPNAVSARTDKQYWFGLS